MKVQSAQFKREIPIFSGTGRKGSYNAAIPDWSEVTATATSRGLQFTRERNLGEEILIQTVNVPYEQVLRWSPADERKPAPKSKPDGGSE